MKILGTITIVALLLGGGAVVPIVAQPAVAVSIDAPAQAAADSDFTANVSIGEVTDFDAPNYDVSFDASVLRLDNVTSGLIGSTTIPVDVFNEISSGTYRIVQNVPGLSGVNGSGYLAVLHFHVIGSDGDSSTISLSNGVLSNNLAQEIPATWVGDSVSVSDTTAPFVTITALTPDPTNDNTVTFTGTATDISSNISSVEYKVDAGSWTAATASDGAFDSVSEGYTFTTAALSDGAHTVYVRATDSATNTTAEANYASDSFTVQTVTPGDGNGDGNVNALDITKVERIIAGLDTETSGADANQDGNINALDITKVERIIAGLDTETPGADANQDGNINALDITKVERMIAGLDEDLLNLIDSSVIPKSRPLVHIVDSGEGAETTRKRFEERVRAFRSTRQNPSESTFNEGFHNYLSSQKLRLFLESD